MKGMGIGTRPPALPPATRLEGPRKPPLSGSGPRMKVPAAPVPAPTVWAVPIEMSFWAREGQEPRAAMPS